MSCSNGTAGLVGTAVGTTVVDARRTGRATVRRTLGTAVGTTVMHARRTRRPTVRRTLGATVGTTVVDTRRTRRPTVRRTLGATVGTTVVDTRRTRRATVRRALVLVRVLLGVRHVSSWKSTVGAGRVRWVPPSPRFNTKLTHTVRTSNPSSGGTAAPPGSRRR
ncbi:hypothetical protein [Streptomyces sp. NPDC002564]|uniref:hypothetical protein n=1 Tax=Streptomyces sp. NPDC002564 TaxID=3364649 RepID=UPI0036A43718